MCPDYNTKEDAVERCYRDSFARVHAYKALFKAETNRAQASVRARLDPRDATDAKHREAETTFQEGRQEILAQTLRRSSLRPRSK